MRRQLHDQTHIEAPAGAVWAVLTDLQAYGQWNPVVTGGQGEFTPGVRLPLALRLPGRASRVMSARVLRVVHSRELDCVVRAGPAGLLDALYQVRVEPSESSGIDLVQSVTVSGILMPFFWLRRRDSIRRALGEFGAALRDQVRQTPGESPTVDFRYNG